MTYVTITPIRTVYHNLGGGGGGGVVVHNNKVMSALDVTTTYKYAWIIIQHLGELSVCLCDPSWGGGVPNHNI